MAVGTLRGIIYVFDLERNELIYNYQAHPTEITSLWLMADKSILSCTRDKIINLRSLNLIDYMHEKITVEFPAPNEQIQCLDVLEGKCVQNNFGCFIGSHSGRVYYMSSKFIGGFKIELLEDVCN